MSEFWKKKVRKYFRTFDADHDGVMTKDDFIGMAVLFCKFEKADKQKAKNLVILFENVWEDFVKPFETDKRNEPLTIEMFVDSMLEYRGDAEWAKHQSEAIHGLFELMDVNCDGYLQDDEYQRMLAQLGVEDAAFANEAFKTIDLNGDGKLSIDEFIKAFIEFMYSEDEQNPYTHFFGPVDD